MDNYEDIINLSRPKSKYPSMSIYNRSAQFAPFAALTGYDDEVKEAARMVSKKISLSEDAKTILDANLALIANDLSTQVNIIYFVKDNLKVGGEYKDITTTIKKIDSYNKCIILSDNQRIRIDDIYSINIIK